MFALGSSSNGGMGGLRSLTTVRQVLELGLGALVLPDQFAVPRAKDAFGEDGHLKNKDQPGELQGADPEACARRPCAAWLAPAAFQPRFPHDATDRQRPPDRRPRHADGRGGAAARRRRSATRSPSTRSGLELLFAGGLDLARALEGRRQARLPRHEAARHRQHGRAGRGQRDRASASISSPSTATISRRMRAAVTGRGSSQLEAARRDRADQPHRRRSAAAGFLAQPRRPRAAARQAGARIRLRRRHRLGPGGRAHPRGGRPRISSSSRRASA